LDSIYGIKLSAYPFLICESVAKKHIESKYPSGLILDYTLFIMKDIETYEDCILLIRKFYDKLLVDDQISHFFIHLDLEEHIPRVADFWAFLLIDKPGYSNNMMTAHAKLELNENDFNRWLALFHQTIHELFSGEKANLAIERSKLIAWTMKSKM
jgi:hemoglobin